MGFRVQRKASPRVTSHPPKVPYTLQIYTFFHHVVNPSPLLEAPWCLAGCPIGSFRSPWCFPGAPQAAQLILSCLPGASQAVQLVLSCLPGASLVPLRLSNWLFPVFLVPPWCLAGCPIDPFLPPWRLAGCPMSPFPPPWRLSGCRNVSSCLPSLGRLLESAGLSKPQEDKKSTKRKEAQRSQGGIEPRTFEHQSLEGRRLNHSATRPLVKK